MLKICTKCNQSKDKSEFRVRYDKRSNSLYINSICRTCEKEYDRERMRTKYKSDPNYREYSKTMSKKFREENPNYYKNYKYDLSQDQVDKYKEKAKLYYQKNKDNIKKYQSSYRKTDAAKNSKLKSRYGITLEQYNQILINQGNKCPICSCQFSSTEYYRRPNIDHCHRTDKIRGILCHKCNTGIGLLNDNPKLLQNAIKYLSNLL